MRGAVLAALVAAVVAVSVPTATAAPAGSGAIVFVSNRANGNRELYVVDRDGSGLRRLTYNGLVERQPAWSPDRTRIAFSALDPASGNWDIYSVDANGGDLRRLTTDPGRDDAPQWTADGRIVYQHGSFNCPCEAWIVNADGGGAQQLPTGPGNALTPTASPHGDKLAFASDRAGDGTWAIYTMQLNGRALRQVTFPTAGQDLQPRWSPSGNELAFLRDGGTQDNDLYVMHGNGQGLTRLTTTPDRVEFFLSWSSPDEIVLSATGADGFHLYAIPAAGGPETPLSTVPQAPYVDSFDEPSVDTSFWYTLVDPGSSLGLVDGQLVTSIAGSAEPGGQWNQVAAQIGSPCHLRGDFDMQVDYRLLTWPEHGGYFASLSSIFADVAVARSSAPWDPPYNQQYNGWSNAPGGFLSSSFNTSDTSGSLRITRTGSVVHAYERSGGSGWNEFFSADGNTGEGIPQLGLAAQAWDFGHQDGSVAFDDFRIDSGALTCPSWWQDFAPDVAY
jgi:hypothetical protein